MPIDQWISAFSSFTVHTPKLRYVRLNIGVELRYSSGVSEKGPRLSLRYRSKSAG